MTSHNIYIPIEIEIVKHLKLGRFQSKAQQLIAKLPFAVLYK